MDHTRTRPPNPPAAQGAVRRALRIALIAAVLPAGAATARTGLNVLDFGVVCDGKTDDYPAFSRALAQAGQNSGSVLFFPPAAQPCMTSKALRVPDGVTLDAVPGRTVIKAAANNRSNPMLLEVGNRDTVRGLSFDGGGDTIPGQPNVIQGYRVQDVTFDHISVIHTSGPAMVLSSEIRNVTITHSRFSDIGNAWKRSRLASDRRPGVVFCCGSGNRGNSAFDNRFEDIGLDALQFSDQSDVRAAGNRFYLENGQRRVVTAPDYPAAIFLLRVDHAAISTNRVEGAQGAGIDAPALTNSTLDGNTISGSGSTGIGLFNTKGYDGPLAGSDRVVVRSNTIIGNTAWDRTPHPGGITLSGSATRITVTGNRIANDGGMHTQKFGLYVLPGTEVSGLNFDDSNQVAGNLIGPFGPPGQPFKPRR